MCIRDSHYTKHDADPVAAVANCGLVVDKSRKKAAVGDSGYKLLQEMLAHELHRAVKLVVGIFLFREAVSFVVGEEIPDRGALFF